ncbi:sortase [Candidatus Saccharibacteria bacterium]|nr:sortase [Candidatus Saccharibacteria bacterium]
MAKSLFLFIISILLGLASSSTSLMAADKVSPRSPIFTDPLTVEIKPEPAPEPANTINIASVPIYTAPANSITIAGRTIEIVNVASTTVNAGNHVNKYGEKFLYGHNSYNVFGALLGLNAGATFSVKTDGVTKNYVVSRAETFEKNRETGKLQKDGKGSLMYAVSLATYGGVSYDLALMTCAGTSYGNGDASHRYVLFANQI